MARRLKTIARFINENLPDLEAKIEQGYCNTDRKVGRLRVPGRGRIGSRLKGRRRSDGKVILDHNSAETYRTNREVEAWLLRVRGGWTPTTINTFW